MNAKLAAALVLAIAAAYLWRWDGIRQGRAERDARLADSVATVLATRADSIETVHRQRADSIESAARTRIAQADAALAKAQNDAQRSLVAGRAAGDAARAVLADTLATMGALRAALGSVTTTLDDVSRQLDSTIAATRRALAVRDAEHAQLVAVLRAGFDSTMTAKDSALTGTRAALATALRTSKPSVIRVWGERALWFAAGYGAAKVGT